MQFTRLILTGLVLSFAVQAAPFKKVLTDARKGYRISNWQMVANDMPGYKGEAKWHIRKRILQENSLGKFFQHENKLHFFVNPERCHF